METLTAAPEKRIFYSRAPHLNVTINNPVPMISNGVVTHVGGKVVEFIPLGDGWGWYVTASPEEIAVLDRNRMVVGPDVYNDMTTPDKIKVQMEREEKQRLIVQNNSLLAQLKELQDKAGKYSPEKK